VYNPADLGLGDGMPVDRGSVQLGGHALTLEQIESVARRGASVDLGGEVQQIVADSARRLQHLARADRPVYGVNTGFGVLAGRRVAPEQSLTLSRNLILSHAVGVGQPFSPDVTRAAMVIRANALALGLSGVSPHVLSALIGLLNARITPAIPSQGSLGSSGDLAPLAHLALALIAPDLVPDTPEAWVDERRMPLRRALAEAGLSPNRPGAEGWAGADQRGDIRLRLARPGLSRRGPPRCRGGGCRGALAGGAEGNLGGPR
jgi:histidine ammonia-lyase